MECYEIENKEDALLLACHLLREHRVEGYIDKDGTMILEYKTDNGQWFFIYEKLVLHPIEASLSAPGRGYWCNTQGPLFPLDWELKNTIYPLLSYSPSDNKEFEIPEDWDKKKKRHYYFPFADSDWMHNRRKEIRSWLSEEKFVMLAFLWAAETGQPQTIDILRWFDAELLDEVLRKAACIPRVNEAKFKYLLRTAISEAAATHCADLVTSKVARVIGY